MVKNRISSQYVFGYQKFILYPEDYKTTKSGKKKVLLPELVGKGYGTFWRWKGRYRVCKGSRASKKSKTTALWYITNMMKYPQANTLVVRKTFRTLKDSCFTELKWAIHRLGVDAFWEIKESPLAQYVDQLYLYGSYARHQHRYDSDIDLLLELNETVNIDDYRDDVFRLIGQVCQPDIDYPEVHLNIVVGDKWRNRKMLFYQNVKRDCINIWEPDKKSL